MKSIKAKFGMVTHSQSNGDLGNPEFGQNIYSDIIIARPAKLYKQEYLQVILKNGFVFQLEGSKEEFENEIKKIIEFRKNSAAPLESFEDLKYNKNLWALDPNYVIDVKSETRNLNLGGRAWVDLAVTGNDKSIEKMTIGIKRTYPGGIGNYFTDHMYGPAQNAEAIKEILEKNGWKPNKTSPDGPTANL